jgi:hypothetical protein
MEASPGRDLPVAPHNAKSQDDPKETFARSFLANTESGTLTLDPGVILIAI